MLEIVNLCVGYGGLPVLTDVTLRVGDGEFVAIVGPNGAGKTTLFKAISGIVQPSSGAIRYHGQDLLAVAPAASAPGHCARSRRPSSISLADDFRES